MMLEPSDIRRLLDAFEQSDWTEIRLSMDGVDVFISASDAGPATAAAPVAAVHAPAGAPVIHALAVSPAPSPGGVSAPASDELPAGEAVRSPSPGFFWRAPAPGAPPFIEVGQHVEAGTVIGIVEVMKLMNRVIAGVAGQVVAILVENGRQVARDQPLVIIAADDAHTA